MDINCYPDICQAILYYVQTQDLLYNCKFVCKKWNELLDEQNAFWRSRFFHLYEQRNDRRVADDMYLRVKFRGNIYKKLNFLGNSNF